MGCYCWEKDAVVKSSSVLHRVHKRSDLPKCFFFSADIVWLWNSTTSSNDKIKYFFCLQIFTEKWTWNNTTKSFPRNWTDSLVSIIGSNKFDLTYSTEILKLLTTAFRSFLFLSKPIQHASYLLLAKTQPIKEDVKEKNAVFLLLASGRQMVNPVIGSVVRFLSQPELLTGPESIFCLPSRYRFKS